MWSSAAAFGLAGAGIQGGVGNYRTNQANIAANKSAFGNEGLAGFGHASGGLIRGFASGGFAGRDTIPAMLTGGEYVMKRGAVQRHGVDFFNRLNGGKLKMANGGFVGDGSSQTSGGGFSDKLNDSIMRLVISNETLKDTLDKSLNPNKNNKSTIATPAQNAGTAVNVYSTITIQNMANGETKSTQSTKVDDKSGQTNNDIQRQLGTQVEAAVIKVMIDQSKPGGLLYERINRR